MDYSALLELLNNLNAAVAVEDDEVLLYIQQFKDGFLKLLDFKGPSPESRRQVQELRRVTTKFGVQLLDPEPDVRLALLLSDELRLDEVLCVKYLTAGLDERGAFGAEVAAGLYLEERRSCLRCLAALLAEDARVQGHGGGGGGAGQGSTGQATLHAQAIAAFVSELLSEKDASGRQVLLSRLIAVLKDTSLEPRPGTPLPAVRDEAGHPVPRGLLLQRERREAARCCLLAAAREPAVAPAVAGELVELLGGLLSRLGGTGSGDLFLVEECQAVLLAACAVLLPHEGRDFGHQQAALQELANAVRSRVEAVTQPGYGHVLRLCWGLLAVRCGAAPQDGMAAVREALRQGALTFLKQVFAHPHFKLGDPAHPAAVAGCVHGLVGTLLRTDADRPACGFFAQLLARNEAAIRPHGPPSAPVLGYTPLPPESPESRADHLGSVLALLAGAFEAAPELYLANLAEQEAGSRPVKELLDRAINHPIMRASPEVRVPFLQLMAALAGTPRGAHLVLRQMEAMAAVPALELLTLRKLFAAVTAYCCRFHATLAEQQRQQQAALAGGQLGMPGGQPPGSHAASESIINPAEADILIAGLGLLRRILEHGRPGEVAAWWGAMGADMAPQLNGYPLQEPLFQLMCYPCSPGLKAALDGALGALAAALPAAAPRLLERLLACTVVRPTGAVMAAVPRLDLVQQLAEVEARREEYPETLALLRLLNDLLGPCAAGPAATQGSAGGAGAAGLGWSLPDGGADVAVFTAFVQQHVLGHLWQRGYRVAAQKWELAAAAFTHLEHVLSLALRGPVPPPLPPAEAAAAPRQPPGYLVMHDLLGGGPAYAALLHILLPGLGGLTQLGGATDQVAPREAAVLSGLRLLNTALRLDGPFARQLEAQGGLGHRYAPLHSKLLAGGVRLVATLLQYVAYPDSAEIQVEAIRLAAELFARVPALVEMLARAAEGGPAGGMGLGAGGGAAAAAASAAGVTNGVMVGAEDLGEVLGALRRGFAAAMAAGAADPVCTDGLDAPGGERSGPNGTSSAASPDPRAALVLRLLLDAAPPPPSATSSGPLPHSPSAAHLLLGYDMEAALGGRLDESVLLPRAEFSCLTVIERLLTQHEMRFAATHPRLHCQCLGLLHRMAAAPPGAGGLPMLEYLSPANHPLIPSLRGLLCMELPGALAAPPASSAYGGSGMGEEHYQYGGAGAGGVAPEARPHELAAALHARSYFMRVTALLLLRLQPEDPARELLAELFALPNGPPLPTDPAAAAPYPPVPSAAGSLAGASTLLHAMRAVSSIAVREPSLSDLAPDVRRMLGELSSGGEAPLEQLLTSPTLQNSYGITLATDTGEVLYDVGAVYGLLRGRLEAYAARAGALGGGAEAAAGAARAVLVHCQRANAAALVAGGQVAALEGWQQLVQVIFTRQYDQLSALLARGGSGSGGAGSGAAEALADTLSACCDTLAALLGAPSGTTAGGTAPGLAGGGLAGGAATSAVAEAAAGPLCATARVLLAKLQEQAAVHGSMGPAAAAADPLAPLRLPSRAAALLRSLCDLALAAAARRAPGPRLQLYAALLAALQLLRGGAGGGAAGGSPVVLAAALAGAGGLEAAAEMDQAAALLDRALAAVVSDRGPALVAALAGDALSAAAPPLGQAVALHLLRALLAAEEPYGSGGGGAVCGAVYGQGVPQQLLAALAALPAAALTGGGKRARRAVHVTEAALALLTGLAAAGPAAGRAAAAQRLYQLNAIGALVRCSALDLVPDDPSAAPARGPGPAAAPDSLRWRLSCLAAPCLRLLLSLLAALPDSPQLAADAAAFAGAHAGLLGRLLAEAAGAGRGGGAPSPGEGEGELALADLALGLLVRLLPGGLALLQPLAAQGLLAAAHRLAFQFCCLEEKSSSALVAARRAEAGAAPGGGGGGMQLALAPGGGAGGGAQPGGRAVAIARGERIMSVRCSLARLLRDMSAAAAAAPAPASAAAPAAPSLCALLRLAGPPSHPELDPLSGRPTLSLVRDCARQACRDAAAALDELAELLALLRTRDEQLDEQLLAERLQAYAPPGSPTLAAAMSGGGGGGLAARRRLARQVWGAAAGSLDRQLGRALYVLEAGLATITIHFLRCLPRPMDGELSSGSRAGRDTAMDGDAAGLLEAARGALELPTHGSLPAAGESDAAALGTRAELEGFMVRLADVCGHVEELLGRLAAAAADWGQQIGGGALAGGRGGGGGMEALAAGGGGEGIGGPVEGIDLMMRALRMYCAQG